jgi:hypothetical protein
MIYMLIKCLAYDDEIDFDSILFDFFQDMANGIIFGSSVGI